MSLKDTHITLRNLGLRRNDRWLFRGLNLEIPRGAFLAIVGSSGVGKTSLLHCLSGLLRPTEGEVCYCGEDSTDCRTEQRDVCHLISQRQAALIFQDLSLVANATLLNNVLCGRLNRYPWWRTLFSFPRTDRKKALAWLQELGIGALQNRTAGEVSGGERQRAAVARALFQEPEIYLADEPVASLDAYYAGRVLGLFRQECERQRTVLCVLHQAAQVERFADMVLGLNPMNAEDWNLRMVQR